MSLGAVSQEKQTKEIHKASNELEMAGNKLIFAPQGPIKVQ
jgi:hypothetical protein